MLHVSLSPLSAPLSVVFFHLQNNTTYTNSSKHRIFLEVRNRRLYPIQHKTPSKHCVESTCSQRSDTLAVRLNYSSPLTNVCNPVCLQQSQLLKSDRSLKWPHSPIPASWIVSPHSSCETVITSSYKSHKTTKPQHHTNSKKEKKFVALLIFRDGWSCCFG